MKQKNEFTSIVNLRLMALSAHIPVNASPYLRNKITGYLLLLFIQTGCNNMPEVALINNLPEETEFIVPETDKLSTIEVLYSSSNNGKTWSPFSNGIPGDATVSGFLAKANKIFLVTVAHGAFVWESGFAKWKPTNNGLPDSVNLNAIAAAENILVTGTLKQGIFVSSDEGNTWKPSDTDLQNISVRAFLFIHDTLLAGTDKGIYISTDKGSTWEHAFGSMQVNGFTTLNEKIYAAAANGAVMTNNTGKTWNYIYKRHTLHDISNDGQFIYAMTLGEGLLKTNNDGLNWQNANTGFGPVNFYTFEIKNRDRDLFAAQWHGIYHSANQGRYWSKINTGTNGLPDSTAFTTLEVTDFGILAGTGLK